MDCGLRDWIGSAFWGVQWLAMKTAKKITDRLKNVAQTKEREESGLKTYMEQCKKEPEWLAVKCVYIG